MTRLRPFICNAEIIIESLEDLKGVLSDSLISFLQESRLRETAIITSGGLCGAGY